MRPDIVVEHVSGLYLFSGETPEGREWLQQRSISSPFERLGKAIAVSSERLARDLADGLDVLE